ncbi:MAG: phenylalanine--tRNA ligase subunit alpha [Flavobacteriales bacterium]|jgi:phenylalanyl-tRNA synthetase alpha chain|nr:phenylalanine--tRNA ligase subunit alpha [Flavobacteriales bacterium]
MLKKLEEHQKQVEELVLSSKEDLENFRLQFLSKKGIIPQLFADFREVPNNEKKAFGQKLNMLKNKAEAKFKEMQLELKSSGSNIDSDIDLTVPPFPSELGTRHPVSMVRREVVDIFQRIGFTVSEGPEIEDDWHNFSALNFPPEHPARDMQDTFFIEKDPDIALRTHTSSVQVRVMENQNPPIRTISPGRVFRNEAISARAHCIFHQVEGLYIDKHVSFADMKDTLLYFAREFYGPETKIRLRPSYFPFTEPSAEMDVYWGLETEADHRITKGTGWLEVLGCGMVDPAVLEASGIDPNEYSGFAFGMGIERTAMLKYQVKDLRLFFENDKRFLNQFKSAY